MGILNIFSKKKDDLKKFERKIARETTDILGFKGLRRLKFKPNGHMNFVLADLSFHLEREYDLSILKDEYKEKLIEKSVEESFQSLKNSIDDYYNGKPNLDKALWNLTINYFKIVWSIPDDMLRDPISLTVYSQYLSQIRMKLKQHLADEYLSKLKK